MFSTSPLMTFSLFLSLLVVHLSFLFLSHFCQFGFHFLFKYHLFAAFYRDYFLVTIFSFSIFWYLQNPVFVWHEWISPCDGPKVWVSGKCIKYCDSLSKFWFVSSLAEAIIIQVVLTLIYLFWCIVRKELCSVWCSTNELRVVGCFV